MNAKTRKQKRESSGRAKKIIISLVVAALLLGGLAAAGSYLWGQYGERVSLMMGWTTNDYEGEGSGETVIVITEGEIGSDVAASLAAADVVKTQEAFYDLLLAQSPAVDFQPGSYRMKLQMSSKAALAALTDPANKMAFTAMIPEGKTVAQTLELVSAGADIPLEELTAAAKDPQAVGAPEGVTSLEGWLFPATYEFEQDTTGAQAVSAMVARQIQELDSLGVAPADRHRVLTFASIVQRESGLADDFGKVARVIQNRLDQDMKLDMDSTAQFGYGQHADGSVWSSDEALSDDNPWNTYVHKGLPQGPIANPGAAAIEATLNPVAGDWLYFVVSTNGDGSSVFNADFAKHEEAVAEYRSWCAADASRGC